MSAVVVFDLDDTLYLERDYVRSGFKAVDDYLQVKKIDGFFTVAWIFFQNGGRGNTFNVVLEKLGVAYDTQLIQQLIRVYRAHRPEILLAPDAEEILIALQNHYRLGLITDGFSVSQNQKIKSLKLEKYIKKIVVTDDLGSERQFWKPHVKPYEVIRDYYGVEHQDCIYVGDNVKKDFISAKKLGWKTIRIAREGAEYKSLDFGCEHQAEYDIGSLKELKGIINCFDRVNS